MKTFNLSGMVTVSVYTTVEAETLQRAIEIAKEREISQREYSDEEIRKYEWVNEEIDGEIFDIHCDDIDYPRITK